MKNVVVAIFFWMASLFFFGLVRLALQKGYIRYYGSQRITRSENSFRFWLGLAALFFGALFLIIYGFVIVFEKSKI